MGLVVNGAPSWLWQCAGGIGTILPVEYMVNGIALGLMDGLKVGIPGDGLPFLFMPRLPMMPPSAENILLTSNPGVVVGIPLKLRQEIWPIPTDFCTGSLMAGEKDCPVLTLSSGGDGSA